MDIRLADPRASLPAIYTTQTVVPPDASTVRWRGRIELEQFDAPAFGAVDIDAASGLLRVQARAAPGIATVRGYGPAGMEQLRLVSGDERDGIWATDGASSATALMAWDRCFHNARLEVDGSAEW